MAGAQVAATLPAMPRRTLGAAVSARIDTVITDLDNTLFDWLAPWYAPFRAMLDVLVEESGVPEEVRAVPEHTVYVGDSLSKDIAVAQQAGLADVYARYGVVEDHPGLALLRDVSQWAVVAGQEKALATTQVTPTNILRDNLAELLPLFDFRPHHLRHRPASTSK